MQMALRVPYQAVTQRAAPFASKGAVFDFHNRRQIPTNTIPANPLNHGAYNRFSSVNFDRSQIKCPAKIYFARHAKDVAIIQSRGYRHESWTYAKLQRQSANFAITLKQKQITTGDRVMIWAPNSAEWLTAFWGVILRGAVAVPMDDIATPEFAARVAKQAGVKLIIKSAAHPTFDASIPTIDVSDLSSTFTSTSATNESLPPLETLADEPITRAHLAQILFTSGTTAEPRGVLLTHGNFLANLDPLEKGIDPYRKYERWFHPLRFVTLVPLSHVFGQFMTLLVPPLLGATVIFESSNNPATSSTPSSKNAPPPW